MNSKAHISHMIHVQGQDILITSMDFEEYQQGVGYAIEPVFARTLLINEHMLEMYTPKGSTIPFSSWQHAPAEPLLLPTTYTRKEKNDILQSYRKNVEKQKHNGQDVGDMEKKLRVMEQDDNAFITFHSEIRQKKHQRQVKRQNRFYGEHLMDRLQKALIGQALGSNNLNYKSNDLKGNDKYLLWCNRSLDVPEFAPFYELQGVEAIVNTTSTLVGFESSLGGQSIMRISEGLMVRKETGYFTNKI